MPACGGLLYPPLAGRLNLERPCASPVAVGGDGKPGGVDLSKESQKTKEIYGIGETATSAFGTQCLLARRMVESGVRFIELGSSGWDHHTDLKEKLPINCESIDKPMAGLIADLKQRDLLKDTLIIWASEFGRTPHATGSGRGHNNKGYTTWMAGGGVKGGLATARQMTLATKLSRAVCTPTTGMPQSCTYLA